MAILQRLFQPSPHRLAGQGLYETATRQARQPAFYTDLCVPDTIEGRFELYTLHVVLLLHRLRRNGADAARTAQALFDAYLQALDDTLREMGVSDTSVGKKMRKLGEAFYGRAKAYEAILADSQMTGLDALIGRTIYAGVDKPQSVNLVDYIQRCQVALQAQPLEQVMASQIDWPLVIP